MVENECYIIYECITAGGHTGLDYTEASKVPPWSLLTQYSYEHDGAESTIIIISLYYARSIGPLLLNNTIAGIHRIVVLPKSWSQVMVRCAKTMGAMMYMQWGRCYAMQCTLAIPRSLGIICHAVRPCNALQWGDAIPCSDAMVYTIAIYITITPLYCLTALHIVDFKINFRD